MNTEELFNLRGKVACVTGASSSIGKHTAKLLVNYGRKFKKLEKCRKILFLQIIILNKSTVASLK
ncbi:MAG: hypothetical protein P8N81_03765 [Paracoccaceae bacterium]|nr:hypothetical protein [Paracoccaceae bacterium]